MIATITNNYNWRQSFTKLKITLKYNQIDNKDNEQTAVKTIEIYLTQSDFEFSKQRNIVIHTQ